MGMIRQRQGRLRESKIELEAEIALDPIKRAAIASSA